jgi:hypothetical protein
MYNPSVPSAYKSQGTFRKHPVKKRRSANNLGNNQETFIEKKKTFRKHPWNIQ